MSTLRQQLQVLMSLSTVIRTSPICYLWTSFVCHHDRILHMLQQHTFWHLKVKCTALYVVCALYLHVLFLICQTKQRTISHWFIARFTLNSRALFNKNHTLNILKTLTRCVHVGATPLILPDLISLAITVDCPYRGTLSLPLKFSTFRLEKCQIAATIFFLSDVGEAEN